MLGLESKVQIPNERIFYRVKWSVDQLHREREPATKTYQSCKGREGGEGTCPKPEAGREETRASCEETRRAHPSWRAATTGTLVFGSLCRIPLLAREGLRPFSTSCRARCPLARDGILFLLLLWYCILMQLYEGSCDLLGCCFQCSLFLRVARGRSSLVFHVPHASAGSFQQLSCTEQPLSLPQEMPVLAIMRKKV